MTPLTTIMESGLRLAADHLWQSSLVMVAAGALLLAGRRWPARWRHAIWLAASIKFLVPVAALVAIGRAVPLPALDQSAAPSAVSTVLAISTPFSAPVPTATVVAIARAGQPRRWWPVGVYVVWIAGGVVLLVSRGREWQRAARLVRASQPLVDGREAEAWRRVSHGRHAAARVDLRSAAGRISPCVIGVWRPTLVWPTGVSTQLSDDQLDAIFVHELEHIERRDNLTSAIQAAAETLFWFHPLVWLSGARQAAERECACDEAVLARGTARSAYADGILRAAAFAIPADASGAPITGSPLVQRIEAIMTSDLVPQFTRWHRNFILVAATVLVLAPVALGAIDAREERGRVAVLGDPPSLVSADLARTVPAIQTGGAPATGDRIGETAITPRPDSRRTSTPPAPQQGSAVIPAVVGPVRAPQGPGEVAGTVTDQTGRSVPGVTVTLVERPSGVVTETSVANARGEYQMTGVKPGIYDLQAKLPGFRTFSAQLSFSAGSAMTMPITMNIGSVSETVTVLNPGQPVAAAADPVSESQLLDLVARGGDSVEPLLNLAALYYRQERFAESAGMVARALAQADLQAMENVVATMVQVPAPGTVAVGGSIRAPRKLRDVKPVYPSAAVAGGTSGIVILEARIAADGSVRDARVLRGAPVLAPAALGAVRQWRFTPTLLNGVPVDVTMTVTVNFAGQ